jgi:cation-transporting P-type ATPase G
MPHVWNQQKKETPVTDSCDCCEHESTEEEAPSRLIDVTSIRLAMASGVFLAIGFVLGRTGVSFSWVPTAAALGLGGWTFIPESLKRLPSLRVGVDTLMTIAAIGAVILGELGEAATLAFLFSISEGLEGYSLTKARRSLRSLLSLVPETARIRLGLLESDIPAAQLLIGDLMVIRPGERVVTDGVVKEGHSVLDVSAITGESIPVEVSPGDSVFAGSINGSGAIVVEVTAAMEDNSLARMVHLVEEAQERKGVGQRLADRIARPLVPGILLVSTLIAIVGSVLGDPALWVHRALVVLVAAAPCAFAISVPVTVFASVGAATRAGVLIKGGAALEALARVRIVALDKTGTLTRNSPKVVETVSANGAGPAEILALAAGLEARSEHPLGRAILDSAPSVPAASSVNAVPGSGLTGVVEGASLRLGRPGFIDPGDALDEVARLQQQGSTVVLLERDGVPLGAIAVRDDLRNEASEAVSALQQMGNRVVMLTGDNRQTAQAHAETAGINEVFAELLPEDKSKKVTELSKQAPVAMVGDGINDAPALATADVGIAMGAMGVDVAVEAADVALMGESLTHLPETFSHARRSVRIMRQNLLLSGAILVALIPLAAAGLLGLAAVVAAHEVAEIVVIGNGLRAGRWRH